MEKKYKEKAEEVMKSVCILVATFLEGLNPNMKISDLAKHLREKNGSTD